MTVRFGNYRLLGYVSVFSLSGVVLGLSANFANLFLPSLHHDFTIYSLVVSSLTIVALLVSLQWAQPVTEVPMVFVLAAMWLAEGAWAEDIVGYTQCDSLGGQTIPTKSGSMSARSYCYEMKVIEALGWMNFVIFSFSFIILHSLINRAQNLGRPNIWYEPIRELPWFGEMPGYYNQLSGAVPMSHYPQQMYSNMGSPQYVQASHGTSLIIQPGVNGAPATITRVPGHVESV